MQGSVLSLRACNEKHFLIEVDIAEGKFAEDLTGCLFADPLEHY